MNRCDLERRHRMTGCLLSGRRTSRSKGNPKARREPAMPRLLHMLLRLAQQIETLMADSSSRFGFVAFAETWNGRLAMLGFVIGLATELLTGQGVLQQIGLG